jgi:hypothetical protein
MPAPPPMFVAPPPERDALPRPPPFVAPPRQHDAVAIASSPAPSAGPPCERIDLVWYDTTLVDVIAAARLGVEPRAQDDARTTISRVLGRGRPSDLEDLRDRYARAPDAGHPSALALVSGRLEPSFDAAERLRATLALVIPFRSSDKQLAELCEAGEAALSASGLPGGAAASHVERIETRLRQLARSSTISVTAIVDQALLESLFTPPGAPEGILTYLGAACAEELPLMRAFPVRAVVELRPPQQEADVRLFTMRVIALARLVERGR